MSKKECPVCTLFNSDSNFGNYINSLLKRDTKVAEIIVELTNRNYTVPSEHYLKKHKINCLKGFIYPISQESISLIDNKNVKKIESVDIEVNWEVFNSLSFAQKDSMYHEILNRLYYSKLVNLDDKKSKINKDDITMLKTLNDLVYMNNLNVSDIDISVFENDTSRNKLELLGLELMQGILKKGIIDPKYALEIVKLNLKNILDLDCWNPKNKKEEDTPEKKAARIREVKMYIQWVNAMGKGEILYDENDNLIWDEKEKN